MKIQKGLIGKLLLFSATVIWGSSFIILKDTLSAFSGGHFTFFILAVRFLLASACFLLVSVKKIKIIDKAFVKDGVILGAFLFFAYAFQTVGLKYTTASKNAFLTAAYCIMVPFMVWIFTKKHPSVKNYIAAVVCLLGVALVGLFGNKDKGSNELLGDALSLLCGIFYALQIFFNPRLLKGRDPFVMLLIECATTGVLFALTSAFYEFPAHYGEFAISGEATWKIAYLAFFATCYAQFAQLVGQKYVSSTTASLILSCESVFGMIFDIIFGNAQLTFIMVLGFICIFSAIIMNEVEFSSLRLLNKKND